jgi:hypothetical protein
MIVPRFGFESNAQAIGKPPGINLFIRGRVRKCGVNAAIDRASFAPESGFARAMGR